jgi:hypothetical protein
MKSHAWAPRLAAWLVSLMLIGAGTAASLVGMQALTPPPPYSTSGKLMHVHGLIVAMERNDTFAVRVPGRKAWLWMRCASDARISLAHLGRHLSERAPTDVQYQVGPHGVLLAVYAD